MPLSQKQIEKLFKGWRVIEFHKYPHPLWNGWSSYVFLLQRLGCESTYKIHWKNTDEIIYGDANIPKGLLTSQGKLINNLLAVLLQKVKEDRL